MKMTEIQNVIETMSPLDLQEQWDNSGFQIILSDDEVNKILVAMEVTPAVINEAIMCNADLIVTHHPLIFDKLNQVNHNDIIGNMIVKLIKAGISVYSTHTPFDKCNGGNNDYLASLLHLCNVKVMDSDDVGYCRYGFTQCEYNIAEYIDKVCEWLKIDKSFVSFAGDTKKRINKVGICTGSGADFIEDAFKENCDLFITGDVKYHAAQTARELGINVLDIGHYGSEKIFTENIALYLRENTDVCVIMSERDLNPFVKI